jgi:hypothetical protein
LAIRAGADLHPTIRAISNQATDDFHRIMVPVVRQAAADRIIDRVIAKQATAGRMRTERAIANLTATYHAALLRLYTAQRETIYAAVNRARIDQPTTTADQERIDRAKAFQADQERIDQERIDQAMAIQAAADRERIDQAMAIQAAADQERIDQAMAIQAAADRERVDQAKAIKAAADQTIAENAEVYLIS